MGIRDDAMILPYGANLCRIEFSERTGPSKTFLWTSPANEACVVEDGQTDL